VNDKLSADLVELVRRLLKPGWPWVSYELHDVFLRKLVMHGLGVVHTRVLEAIDHVPNMRHIFAVKPEESRLETFERLHREFAAVAKSVLAGAETRGRLPRRKLGSVERNAHWFYRNRVLGESVSSLAKKYHERHCTQAFGAAHDDSACAHGHSRGRALVFALVLRMEKIRARLPTRSFPM
jgi:hypothetical protein